MHQMICKSSHFTKTYKNTQTNLQLNSLIMTAFDLLLYYLVIRSRKSCVLKWSICICERATK